MDDAPGRSARKMARRERRWATYLLIGFLVLDAIVLLFSIEASRVANGSLLALTFALGLWVLYEKLSARVTRHFSRARAYDAGAQGEEEVARMLAGESPEEYFVASDLVFPAGNIDHVVFCRSGALFAIETKSCKGRVDRRGEGLMINDVPFDRDPIEQVTREALWVKDTIAHELGITIYVRAVVLFTQAFVNVRGPIRGVEVSSLRYLKRVLSLLPTSADQREVLWHNRDRIAATLRGQHPRSDQAAA